MVSYHIPVAVLRRAVARWLNSGLDGDFRGIYGDSYVSLAVSEIPVTAECPPGCSRAVPRQHQWGYRGKGRSLMPLAASLTSLDDGALCSVVTYL